MRYRSSYLIDMKAAQLFWLVVLVAAVASCSPRVSTSGNPDASLQDNYTSLAQAARNLPNVQVTGEYAVYRGADSFENQTEMKVIAKGRIIGGLADAGIQFPLNEIARLRLVKPLEASQRYGIQASGGAIELILKEEL